MRSRFTLHDRGSGGGGDGGGGAACVWCVVCAAAWSIPRLCVLRRHAVRPSIFVLRERTGSSEGASGWLVPRLTELLMTPAAAIEGRQPLE